MKYSFIYMVFCILFILLIPGVYAESLISFEQTIHPDPYATEKSEINAGRMNVPAGPGIIEVTEVYQPFWVPENAIFPLRAETVPVYPDGESGFYMTGSDFYQSGAEVQDLSFSNGIPLKGSIRYFTNYSEMVPYYVILSLAQDTGNRIDDYLYSYSAEWTPLTIPASDILTGDPSGTWDTSLGMMNLTVKTESLFPDIPLVSGTLNGDREIQASLHGPVCFGSWEPGEELALSGKKTTDMSGQFFIIFDDDWTTFSGTKGNGHSDTNEGTFTGKKILEG